MKCDCGKKFLATVAVFVFKIIAGVTLCGGIFSWVYTLAPVNVWRPMGPSKRLFAGMFLASFLFVAVYQLLRKAFEGMPTWKKGLAYGLCVWAAGIVPGMIATYVFMTVNTAVVAYWTLSMMILVPVQGGIVAFLLQDSRDTCGCFKKTA